MSDGDDAVAKATKHVDVLRRAPQGKRPSKSANRSRSRGEASAQPKSAAVKRGPPAAKPARGKPASPSRPAATRDSQSHLTDICRQRIDAEVQPARIVQLAGECEAALTNEALADEIRRAGTGARQVLEVQRAAGMSSDLFSFPDGDPEFRVLVRLAARGDRQAAYRIAEAYKTGMLGVEANTRRMEQWLRYSADLGDGRASWELAEHYNYAGLVADAAKYEKRAEDLGFRPVQRLPSRGY